MQETIVEKTCWSDIKQRVKKLNNTFYEKLEDVKPGNDLPLFVVKFPYGYLLSDDKGFYPPKGYEDIVVGSGFDKHAPLRFVLENQIQYFYTTHSNHMLWKIQSPGDYFPTTLNVELEGTTRFHPKSIFSVISGIRDVTLLSLHGNTKEFYNLRRKYNIPVTISPADPLNHFDIIKQIIKHEDIKWYTTVLVFPKEWHTQIYENKNWWPFKEYLLENALRGYRRSLIFLDQAIQDITREMDYQFRPYAHEIIRQVLSIAVGEMPGFRPSNDNSGFPVDDVSEAIKNSFRELLSYPIFMQASMMKENTRNKFIYNSITYNTSTKYQLKSNPNSYLNEIMIHLREYLYHFKDHLLTRGTIYSELYDSLEIISCSTRGSNVHDIKKCSEMYDIDKSFWYPKEKLNYHARYGAPINAQFCKGFLGFRWT